MDVQNLEKSQRNKIIKELCDQGAGFRQLARITGISYGIIQRVVTDQRSGPNYAGAFHFRDSNGTQWDTEYEYDKNGRLTRDRNKGIWQIQYNLLNLPSKTSFGDGGYINYQYSASGMKQMVWGSAPGQGSKSQFYLGNYVYGNGVKQLLVDGGYVTFSGTTPQYHFYVKDHLGNNRMVVNASGTVEQVSHYYAFGGLMGENTGSDLQDFKYNGKELDRLHGLDWIDYGARHYDGVIGSWPTMDPLCEKYYSISPYVYCLDNPIKWIDKKGEEPGDPFPSPDAAARDFGMIYNFKSIETNREYGSLIYKYKENGKILYSYNEPNAGKVGTYSVIPNAKRPKNSIAYGDIHTHGKYNGDKNNNNGEWNETQTFSKADKILVNDGKLKASYLCTPDGKLMKYHINEKGNHCIITFNVDLPSDENSPNHNSNTTTSIKANKENENPLNKLWTTISKYLK